MFVVGVIIVVDSCVCQIIIIIAYFDFAQSSAEPV